MYSKSKIIYHQEVVVLKGIPFYLHAVCKTGKKCTCTLTLLGYKRTVGLYFINEIKTWTQCKLHEVWPGNGDSSSSRLTQAMLWTPAAHARTIF